MDDGRVFDEAAESLSFTGGLCSRVQMAPDFVVTFFRSNLNQRGVSVFADLHDLRAAGVKSTSLGWMKRGWDVAFQNNGADLAGRIRYRICR